MGPAGSFGISMAQLTNVPHATAKFNLIAFLAIMAVTTILIIGIKESANFNTGIVFVKLAAVLTFIAVALPFVLSIGACSMTTGKWFLPPNGGSFGSSAGPVWREGPAWYFSPTSGSRCFHRSSGSQESAEGHAHRHSWLARVCTILYIAVSGLLTADGALFAFEYRRSRVAGHSLNRRAMGSYV